MHRRTIGSQQKSCLTRQTYRHQQMYLFPIKLNALSVVIPNTCKTNNTTSAPAWTLAFAMIFLQFPIYEMLLWIWGMSIKRSYHALKKSVEIICKDDIGFCFQVKLRGFMHNFSSSTILYNSFFLFS